MSVKEAGVKFTCLDSCAGKCCKGTPETGYVFLSESDRERLAEHLDLSVDEFELRHCKRNVQGHFHLNKVGECKFLTSGKCSVYEARPTQCRTYPFWSSNLIAWKDTAAFCPGVGIGQQWTKEEIHAQATEQARSESECYAKDTRI